MTLQEKAAEGLLMQNKSVLTKVFEGLLSRLVKAMMSSTVSRSCTGTPWTAFRGCRLLVAGASSVAAPVDCLLCLRRLLTAPLSENTL